MSSQYIVSMPVAKPKVFRLPPASPAPVTKHRSSRKWRWVAVLALLALVWPPLQKATAYFTSHKDLKSAAARQDHDGLEGVLQPTVEDAQAALPAEKPPTILLRGRSEAIIGQMAKIPSDSEPIIETTAASDVDNNTARELLSIVSKY